MAWRSTSNPARLGRFARPHRAAAEVSAMNYVDGYVVPVPKDRLQDYIEMSQRAGTIWREHGALEYRESVADDVKVGVLTSFPQSVQLKDNEVVVFSWIVYESREQRDAVNAKVMTDPRLADLMDPTRLPFDGKRMFHGGFRMIVAA